MKHTYYCAQQPPISHTDAACTYLIMKLLFCAEARLINIISSPHLKAQAVGCSRFFLVLRGRWSTYAAPISRCCGTQANVFYTLHSSPPISSTACGTHTHTHAASERARASACACVLVRSYDIPLFPLSNRTLMLLPSCPKPALQLFTERKRTGVQSICSTWE